MAQFLVLTKTHKPARLLYVYTEKGKEYARVRCDKYTEPKMYLGFHPYERSFLLSECELVRVKSKFEKAIIKLFKRIKNKIICVFR